MSRILLIVALLLGAGCDHLSDEHSGEPWIDALAQGVFIPRAPSPWLEVRDVFHAGDGAWQLPPVQWLGVEDGWGGPEDWGAWGLGERTRLRVHLRQLESYDFYIHCSAPPGGRRQTVGVHLNGRELGSFEVGSEWLEHRLPVPRESLRQGLNDLELRYAYHLDGTLETDDRPLALAFTRLGLLPPETGPDALAGQPSVRLYQDQEVLVLEASGSYVAPLAVPEDADGLDFELKSSGGSGGGMELAVEVLDVAGHRQRIVVSGNGDGPRRIDLTEHRGTQRLLVFDALVPEGGRFTVRRPRISKRGEAVAGGGEEAAGGARPHIVLIVLDAARADHFGAYGYERETTPNIDRLAAESLLFEQAVAECSYTLCSMSSLLTGLDYVQHGMIAKDLTLQDGVRTLAETLRDAGYLTVGFTGNPNNSTITGTHQGFDELYEIWESHPKIITRRTIHRLGKEPGGQPLFLMVHFVPPHEPYAPDPEYEVFGDPGYSGPVTSDRAFTRAVYAEEIELDDADRAEMVSLYDGNLRMADEAVGRILKNLKRRGLFDDALVIVTSDHGEAFLEHGRVGHNTTIYDEMLRVPLIVKLPRGTSADGVDTQRLVTLGDLPPTIYRLLGLESPAQVRALDLLAPAGEAERVLFLRSAHATEPVLGLRTGQFKAISRDGQLPELYELNADPGEESNEITEDPVFHAGLSLLLAQAFREPGTLRAGVRTGEISEEDKKMLEALGYL